MMGVNSARKETNCLLSKLEIKTLKKMKLKKKSRLNLVGLYFVFALLLKIQAFGNVCGSMPVPSGGKCNEHLLPNFVPCAEAHCEIFHETATFHDVCSKAPLYGPVASIDCCNPETKQWIQDVPEYKNIAMNEIMKTCMQLGNPWNVGTCYCCCDGSSVNKDDVVKPKALAENTNPCLSVPTESGWVPCSDHLKLQNFLPICPTEVCQNGPAGSIYHDACMKNGPYTPVPSFDCCNPETKQWLQDLPEYKNTPIDQVMEACQKLGNPWNLGTCYCCCGEVSPMALNIEGAAVSDNCNINLIPLPSDPSSYVSYFTVEEAKLIGKESGPADCVDFIYLINNLFKTFDSKIVISYDASIEEANVYSFETEDETKVVLVSGGLIRTNKLKIDGLAMMIGNAFGRFLANSTAGKGKFAYVSDADYYAFATVSRKIWATSEWGDKIQNALNQIQQLCSPFNSEKTNNNCEHPGIATRIKAMQSGMIGGLQQTCQQLLSLNSANAQDNVLDLIFNMGLEDNSALSNKDNYVLVPAANIKNITLDQENNYILHLSTEDLKSVQYKICVKNLVSINHNELDPNFECALFVIQPSDFVDARRDEF